MGPKAIIYVLVMLVLAHRIYMDSPRNMSMADSTRPTSQPDPLEQHRLGLRLIDAVLEGHLSVAGDLVNQGADLDVQDGNGNTALYYACAESQITGDEALKLIHSLVENGANIDKSCIGGCSPLGRACESGAVEVVAYLTSMRGDVRLADKQGETPLHMAVGNAQCTKVMEVLRSHHAFINALDKDGKTPLDLANDGGHEEAAEWLRGHGGKSGKN